MKTVSLVLLSLVMATVCLGQTFQPTMNFQGVLRDGEGQAVPDASQSIHYNFKFELFSELSGGSHLWDEEHTNISVVNGVYSAILGSIRPFSMDGVAFDSPYFVQVTVNNNTLNPRVPLSLAPYSMAVVGSQNIFPSEGNVGIGVANPVKALQVSGTIRIDGPDGFIVLPNISHIRNASGLPFLDTGIRDDFGDFTAIRSGNLWDEATEPLSVVAGANGFFVTRRLNSNSYGKVLLHLNTDGDMSLNGSLEMTGDLNVDGSFDVSELVAENLVVPNASIGGLEVGGNMDVVGNITSNGNKLFRIESYNLADNTNYWTTGFPTYMLTSQWNAVIAGFNAGNGDLEEAGEGGLLTLRMVKQPSSGTAEQWAIKAGIRTQANSGNSDAPHWVVHVLFIKKSISDDNRTDW